MWGAPQLLTGGHVWEENRAPGKGSSSGTESESQGQRPLGHKPFTRVLPGAPGGLGAFPGCAGQRVERGKASSTA